MEAAFEYSFSSMNMDFAMHLTADRIPIPERLFVDIVAEKMFTPCALFDICSGMFNSSHQCQ